MSVDDRRPVPDAAAQKAALDIIKQIFEADYAAAKSAEGETADHAEAVCADRHHHRRPCRPVCASGRGADLAAGLADTAAIDKAVDALAADYRVDALAMQADIYKKLAAKPPAIAAANKTLAEKALALANRAMAQQQLDAAEQLLKTAAVAGGKARDAVLVKQARLKNDELTLSATASKRSTRRKPCWPPMPMIQRPI